MTTENDVRQYAIRLAKTLGLERVRMHFGPGAAVGWPDDWFLVPGGRPLIVEFKRPGGETSAMQDHRIETLEKLGYDVHVIDNKDAAREALTSALAATRLST